MLRVRIEEDVFNEFKNICKTENTTMSKEIYAYICKLINDIKGC